MDSSFMEKELTCAICTDILYDPVTLLDCLHTNCGACAKSWFASTNSADSNEPGSKSTCPVCRSVVRATKPNPTIAAMLSHFIEQNPLKARGAAEVREMRKIYKPGDVVLPVAARSVASGSINTPPPSAGSSPINAITAIRRRPSSPTSALMAIMNGDPAGGIDFPHGLGPTPAQINRFRNHIECDHCGVRVDYSLHYHCSDCSADDFDLCVRCYRLGKGCLATSSLNHTRGRHLIQARKVRLLPIPYIQAGAFCDSCETWVDSDIDVARGGVSTNRWFWNCRICKDGSWDYCMTCVSKGNCCTHDLELYTHTRPLLPLLGISGSNNLPRPSATIRGNRPDLIIDALTALVARLDISPSATTTRQAVPLLDFGYKRVESYQVSCDVCHRVISSDVAYAHCYECAEGQWDQCLNCVLTNSPSPSFSTFSNNGNNYRNNQEDAEETWKCPQNHSMALQTQNSQTGYRKLILEPPHTCPSFLFSPSSSHSQSTPTTATALKPHWPEEEFRLGAEIYKTEVPGERVCGWGGLLGFPEGAVISEVVFAFEDELGGEGYWWGWYAGVGGVFPGGVVRIEV